MAVVLLLRSGRAPPGVGARRARLHAAPEDPDRWAPFARLSGAVVCRAIVFYGLNTFIPLYWIHASARSKSDGGHGADADVDHGCRRDARGRLARRPLRPPGRHLRLADGALSLCSSSSSRRRAPPPPCSLLVPIGLALFAPFSVMTVMGQEYLPGRVGTASGVTVGLA